MRKTTLACWLVSSAAYALGACVETPDFAEETLIDRPRVLAIVAEPPEVAPGEGTEVSILLAGFDELDAPITWRACGAFDTMVGGSQYSDEDREGGCVGDLSVPVGEGDRVRVPGEATEALFDNLEVAQEALGAVLPERTIALIRDRVGLAVTIEARVRADGNVYRATKKVIVNGERQHRNPPAPHFELGEHEITAVDDDSGRCGAEGAPARLALDTNEDYELAPVVDGDQEPWLETYLVLNARSELLEREERGFYSWYSDAGELATETTRAPLRNNEWRTPGAPGCHSLWSIVRDGHGGTSFCRLDVVVGEPEGGCEDG